MKTSKTILVSILSAVSISAFAATPYIGISGGLSILSDSGISGAPVDEFSYDTGYNIEGVLGAAYESNPFRAEVAVGYQQNDLDEASAGGMSGSIDGDLTLLYGMANAYYDFDTGSAITPFVLGGLGLVNANIDADGPGDEDDTVFGGQIGAGIAFDLTENVAMDLKYRYLMTQDLDIAGADVELGGHIFSLGARFGF